jgi:hypothetical protein
MYSDLPLKVALHLPTLLTLKTACGSHTSSNTSSGEKVVVVDDDTLGGVSASARIELLICTRAASDDLGTKWKEYGNGSSLYNLSALSLSEQGILADLSSELVDEHLEGITPCISRQVDGRSEIASIFSILELYDDRWDRCFGRRSDSWFKGLRVCRFLSFRRWE